MIRNVIEFVGELLHSVVAEVDSVFGVMKVSLEDSADILPLLDELLTSWRIEELMIKFVVSDGSSGLGPFFESSFERFGGWSILDFVGDSFNILGFLLNSSLAIWADRDLEEIGDIVELVGDDGGGKKGSNCELHFF
jgi:hypothetical protein